MPSADNNINPYEIGVKDGPFPAPKKTSQKKEKSFLPDPTINGTGKRDKRTLTGKPSMELDVNPTVKESLNLAQRRQRAINFRRIKSKLMRARKIARYKRAPEGRLKMKAGKAARNIIRMRVAGKKGGEYQTLSPSDKIQIDKLVDKRVAAVRRLASRLLPRVKQAEVRRLQNVRKGVSTKGLFPGSKGMGKKAIVADLDPNDLYPEILALIKDSKIQKVYTKLYEKTLERGALFEETLSAYKHADVINRPDNLTEEQYRFNAAMSYISDPLITEGKVLDTHHRKVKVWDTKQAGPDGKHREDRYVLTDHGSWHSITRTHANGENLRNKHGGYSVHSTGQPAYVKRKWNKLKNESLDEEHGGGFVGTTGLTKRYAMMTPGQGNSPAPIEPDDLASDKSSEEHANTLKPLTSHKAESRKREIHKKYKVNEEELAYVAEVSQLFRLKSPKSASTRGINIAKKPDYTKHTTDQLLQKIGEYGTGIKKDLYKNDKDKHRAFVHTRAIHDELRSRKSVTEEYKPGDTIHYKKNGKGQTRKGVVHKVTDKGYVHVNNGATAVDTQDIVKKKKKVRVVHEEEQIDEGYRVGDLVNATNPKAKPRYKIVGKTKTHYHLERPNGEALKLPKERIARVNKQAWALRKAAVKTEETRDHVRVAGQRKQLAVTKKRMNDERNDGDRPHMIKKNHPLKKRAFALKRTIKRTQSLMKIRQKQGV